MAVVFFAIFSIINGEYPVEQSGAPHLPWDETHSLHFTLDTVHHGLLGFHTTPQSLGHLKETNISQRWDTVSCAPNKDHTLVGALKSPPCCIHLYGSAVVIQTIWGAEWICRDPCKKARPPTAIAHHSPSFPPRSGSIPSVPWGSPLKKRTSFTKTQIRQHMLPSFPPPQTIKREHEKTLTDRWADSHYSGVGEAGLPLSVGGERVQREEQCRCSDETWW